MPDAPDDNDVSLMSLSTIGSWDMQTNKEEGCENNDLMQQAKQYCTCCHNDIFDCEETKYGPFIYKIIRLKCLKRKRGYTNKELADMYFDTYNSIFNVMQLLEGHTISPEFDRDPPICMFVGSYKDALKLSNQNTRNKRHLQLI